MKIIRTSGKQKHGRGPFSIEILYPGEILGNSDTGFLTIGRIDHANFSPPGFVPMHLHRDDEILSYIRKGKQIHRDSSGKTQDLDSKTLMLMNAGSGIEHEEKAVEDVEMLQIFMRPASNGLVPMVQFNTFEEIYSYNKWRLVAGSAAEASMVLRTPTNIFDVRLEKDRTIEVPEAAGVVNFLYCFDGIVTVNNEEILKGDSVIFEESSIPINALASSDLVLFQIKTDGVYSETGMYSGNKYRL